MIVHSKNNPLIIIIEASKEDADKLENIGQEESDLRIGARVVNSITNKNEPDYETKYKINNRVAFNNQKEKSRKELIRDATKKARKFIPSSDTDPRAIEMANKRKRYEDIDIEKTVAKMPKDKANIVRRILQSGGDLPESIQKQLIKKKSIKINPNTTLFHSTYFDKKFLGKEKEIYNRLKELHRIMSITNDYHEYKDAYDEFAKITGYNNPSNFKYINFDDKNQRLSFLTSTKQDKEDIANNNTNYYYTSPTLDITKNKLYPTFKSKGSKSLITRNIDGGKVFYSNPRVYFSKNIPINRSGSLNTRNLAVYGTKLKSGTPTKVDPEMLFKGSSRYVETKKAIPVKRVK